VRALHVFALNAALRLATALLTLANVAAGAVELNPLASSLPLPAFAALMAAVGALVPSLAALLAPRCPAPARPPLLWLAGFTTAFNALNLAWDAHVAAAIWLGAPCLPLEAFDRAAPILCAAAGLLWAAGERR